MEDKLTILVSNVILSLEHALQLDEKNAVGLEKSKMDLQAVLNHCKSFYSSLTPVAKATLNKKISKNLESLYRTTVLCQFKEVSRLDFTEYKGLDKIVETLSLFTVESCITESAISYCNVIAASLDEMDENNPAYKNTLSYKYLRMFLVFTMLNNFVAANCLAFFILSQIAEGV